MKKLFSSRYKDRSISLGLFLLRLAAGGLMIPHGYQKLVGFASQSSSFDDPFGFGGPLSMALTIFAEFFCASFLVLGLMTRLATIPLIIAMTVIIFYSHKGDIFLARGELPALFLATYLVLLIMGPGKWSLDRFIGK